MVKYSNIDRLVKQAEQHDIDTETLLRMVEGKANFTLYEDIVNHDTIDSLLGSHKAIIILYQTSGRFEGHFTTLYKTGDKTLYFFDPYGIKIDEELKFSKFNLRQHKGVPTPLLSALIDKRGYTVTSNTFQYQKVGSNNNECGSHVALRLRLRSYTPSEFRKFMTTNRCYDADYFAVALTILYRLTDILDS